MVAEDTTAGGITDAPCPPLTRWRALGRLLGR